MNTLLTLDHSLFLFFNNTLSNPLFDFLMPIITNSKNLLYSIFFSLFLFGIFSKDKKRAWVLVGVAVLLFAATDLLSYRVLKPFLGRIRPCNPKYFVDGVHSFLAGANFLSGTKTSFSLPSNHAANIFGQAIFWSLIYPKTVKIFILIAVAVAYSRVYMGVHYPFDVFFGAVVGGVLATGFISIYWKIKVGKFWNYSKNFR